jgi:hypothetical protein
MFMQKLFKRTVKEHTYGCRELTRKTQVRSNCGLFLNSSERARNGEADLKTLNNNPDAYLTQFIGGKTLCQFMF